jgi:hypothetical protein
MSAPGGAHATWSCPAEVCSCRLVTVAIKELWRGLSRVRVDARSRHPGLAPRCRRGLAQRDASRCDVRKRYPRG